MQCFYFAERTVFFSQTSSSCLISRKVLVKDKCFCRKSLTDHTLATDCKPYAIVIKYEQAQKAIYKEKVFSLNNPHSDVLHNRFRSMSARTWS